ncbi:hypothetical protein JCM9533A_35170 [Catenuloplanes niger JCM 9533]
MTPGRQALLALAHLRNGDTYSRLAAGFEIVIATVWRYVQEAILLLSTAADGLEAAMRRIRLLTYVILDGTLVLIDRVADQKPYYWRKTLTSWDERAGRRRRGRASGVGVGCAARRRS